MKAPENIPALSALRGIAALWVLLFHLDVAIFYRDLGPLISHETTGLLQKGYLWVDFFFILSGFIIAHVYTERLSQQPRIKSILHYLWARFSRIYPLHIFTLFIAIVCSYTVQSIYPAVIDGSWKTYFAWQAIPSNLLLTHAMNQHTYLSWNIVSWSIGAEWWTYIAALPCIFLLRKDSNILNSIALLACCICLYFLAKNYGNSKLDITHNYGFFRCLFEFIIGLCVYSAFKQKLGRTWLASDICALVLFIMTVVIFHFEILDVSIIPVFSFLILSCAYNTTKSYTILNSNIAQYLGKISYSIYLIHSLFFLVYWNIFPHIQWTLVDGQLSIGIKIIYVVSFIGLTLLCSHFSYMYIEVPARKKLRSLVSR